MNTFAYLRNSDNKAVASGVTATVFSSAAGYVPENAITLPVSKVHRSTGVSSSEYIELDLGSAQAITVAAVLNHNLSSTATITVKAGASANPSTFSQAMTWRQFDAWVTFASQSYRYWRFAFTDTANADGFIQVGYLVLGTSTAPATFSFRYGWKFIPEFNSRRLETAYFVPNVEEVSRRVRLMLSFGPMRSGESDIIRTTLFETLKKDVTPFFFVPDTTGTDAYFGRLGDIEMIVNYWRYIDVQFIEDGRGNRLTLG